MEYASLLGQPRELLLIQLSNDSVSYENMVNVCRSNKFAKELCETDLEFQRLKQRKIENLLLKLTYLKIEELCGRHEEIQEVCNSDEFWQRKTQRDFDVSYEVPYGAKTWKEEYIQLSLKVRLQRQMDAIDAKLLSPGFTARERRQLMEELGVIADKLQSLYTEEELQQIMVETVDAVGELY